MAQLAGAALIAAAVVLYLGYHFVGWLPWLPLVLHWALVALIGAAGWWLFTLSSRAAAAPRRPSGAPGRDQPH